MKSKVKSNFVGLVALLAIFVSCVSTGEAAEFNLTGLTRVVKGKTIGPDSFVILKEQTIQNSYGIPYVWVEMGVSGTIEGYTALKGLRYETFTDFPDIVLRGRNNFEPYYHGVGRYEAAEGTKLVILFPAAAKDWNRKAYHIAHTANNYGQIGTVKPAGDANKLNPGLGVYFPSLMIDKGYAVLFSSRSSSNATGVGPNSVTLDDGTVLPNKAYGMHAGLFHDLTMVGQRYVEYRLGQKTKRMYFYGKSQGANLGRLFNYGPGANLDYKDPSKKVFDGFIHNSPGGGLFLPVMEVKGKDVLFQTKEDKENFVPQIDVLHEIYVGEQYIESAYWGSYYEVNRDNQRMLNAKGLGAKSRTYELKNVSHEDGTSTYLPTTDNLNLNPEIGGFMDAMIDMLDSWVDLGIKPPPTRSNSYDLGDVNHDGILENPAIELPEIACPTGVYYLFPKGQDGSGNLGFVAYLKEDRPIWNFSAASTQKGKQTLPPNFEESWLEPLNHFEMTVDMNGNGVRDTKESITKAWRRRATQGYKSGILARDETLTHAKYEREVVKVAADLYAQGFLSLRGLYSYVEAARLSDVGR